MKRYSEFREQVVIRIVIAFCVVTIESGAEAAPIPRLSIVAMCDKAVAVVDCTHVGGGTFNVNQVYKLNTEPAIGEVVTVPYFADHPPVLSSFLDPESKRQALHVDRAVLFLQRSKDNAWEPLGKNIGGAQGVVWIGKQECYWYVQIGALDLVPRVKNSPWNQVPIINENPLKEVEIGVIDSKIWRDTLELANPVKRCEALARYLIKRTSSARDFSHFAGLATRRLQSEPLHGPLAVVDAIKHSKVDDNLDFCVGTLTGSFCKMRVQGYHRLLEYSVNVLVPLIGDGDRVDQRQLIFRLGTCARPEPLDRLREIAYSSDNAELAKRVVARIEEDLRKVEATTSKPTEEWAIELWEVYVKREREWSRSKR